MRLQLSTFLLPYLLLLFPHNAASAASVSDFIDYSSTAVPGRLYVPPVATESPEPRPLILFLHGLGETGNNNLSQIGSNINNLLAGAKLHEAYLYAPQAISSSWSSASRTTNVRSMIERAIGEMNVDENRLYVTGLSMGGGGTWNVLSRFSDRFAAGVPIAGINPAGDFNAGNLIGIPTWAFHARNDNVVSKNSSRNTINKILTAAGETLPTYPSSSDTTTTLEFKNGSIELNYTEWPTGRHSIWGRVYDTPEMYEWMFSQTLADTIPEPASGVMLLFAMNFLSLRRHQR